MASSGHNGNFKNQGGSGFDKASGSKNFLGRPNQCNFCKTTKENKEIYSTHTVKDQYGRVICPNLRNIVCPICRATGDNAHTLNFCPLKGDYKSTVTEKNNGHSKRQY